MPSGGGAEVLAAIAGAPLVIPADDGHYYQMTLTVLLGVKTVVWVDLGTDAPTGAILAEEPA